MNNGTKSSETRTSNTGKQLASKLLNMTAGKWHKPIALEEIKHTLTEKVSDDTNVVSEVKAIPEMDAFVTIALVI